MSTILTSVYCFFQVAAAKAPQVLAPRRRKAVNYNEAKLHRKYVTDSESEATAAGAGSDDPDGSTAEDGPQIPKVAQILHTYICISLTMCIFCAVCDTQ